MRTSEVWRVAKGKPRRTFTHVVRVGEQYVQRVSWAPVEGFPYRLRTVVQPGEPTRETVILTSNRNSARPYTFEGASDIAQRHGGAVERR